MPNIAMKDANDAKIGTIAIRNLQMKQRVSNNTNGNLKQ